MPGSQGLRSAAAVGLAASAPVLGPPLAAPLGALGLLAAAALLGLRGAGRNDDAPLVAVGGAGPRRASPSATDTPPGAGPDALVPASGR